MALTNDHKTVAVIASKTEPIDCVQSSAVTRKAKSLAKQLSIPLISISQANDYDFGLFFENGILKLQQHNTDLKGSVFVDFSQGKSAYRLKHQAKGKPSISRACGIKNNHRPKIIDATAGLGEDAFFLAAQGCQLLCIEQNALLVSLLCDGLSRAKRGELWLQDIVARMQLKQGLAETMLAAESAEVVYLDPMYPHQQHRKQAKVKKGMQMFRAFPGTSSNEENLLAAARVVATDRVVVKRPDWALPLAGLVPSFSIPGKKHRFDVYKNMDNNGS